MPNQFTGIWFFLLVIELTLIVGGIALVVLAPALARASLRRRGEPITRSKEISLTASFELFALACFCLAASGLTYGTQNQLIFLLAAFGCMILAMIIGFSFS